MSGLKEAYTLAIGSKTRLVGKANMSGQMAVNTLDPGKKTKCTATGSTHGLTVDSTKATSSMT